MNHRLPERERKGFHSRVGKLNLEFSISYPLLLAHELIRPPTICRPVPPFVDVGSVDWAGRFAVDRYGEPNRLRS